MIVSLDVRSGYISATSPPSPPSPPIIPPLLDIAETIIVMGLLPNIYYHARTPATSGAGEYTFSRLADATARQKKPQQVSWTNKASEDSIPRDPHGYMILSEDLPRAGSSQYPRTSHEGSRQSSVGGCSCSRSHKAGQVVGTRYEALYGSYSSDPAWTAVCCRCRMCRSPRLPGSPPKCLAHYPDTAPQRSRAVKQRDNAWELDSNSDGGVPLEDTRTRDIAVVVDEIVRVIENLQAGYLADTEDGGNGYETYDGDDYSEDGGCSGEDSDDTIRI